MEPEAALRPYVYEPLQSADHVRIIVLWPATRFDDTLKTNIIQYDRKTMHLKSHEKFPVYEAVSYTWGIPNFTHHITCDDTTELSITPNVDTMLRYLRKTTKPRYLWIDAICLNQSDENEKAIQIGMMGYIYKEARKVNIWLGDATATTPQVLSVFAAIGPLVNFEDGVDIFPCSSDELEVRHFRRPEIRRHIRHKKIDERTIDRIRKLLDGIPHLSSVGLQDFLERPWFGRRWILQEASLNRQTMVYCGKYKIPWSSFSSGIIGFREFRKGEEMIKSLSLSEASSEAISVVARLNDRASGLFALLWDFHLSACREPADRIRSLFGLANINWTKMDVELASSDAFSWLKLYETYTRQSLASEYQNQHQILAHVLAFGSLDDVDPEIPSYVPNWSRTRRYTALFNSWANIEPSFPRPRSFQVSRKKFFSFDVGNHNHLSFVHKAGVQTHWSETWRPIVAMFEHIRPTVSESVKAPSRKKWFRHRSDGDMENKSETLSLDIYIDALQRLLAPDLMASLNDTEPIIAPVKDFESLVRWLTEPNPSRENLAYQEWPLWIQQVFQGLHTVLERYSLLVIDDTSWRGSTKIVALCPCDIQIQDRVASYNGPFLKLKSISLGIVLRPWKDDMSDHDRLYKIIGPCFILTKAGPPCWGSIPSNDSYPTDIT